VRRFGGVVPTKHLNDVLGFIGFSLEYGHGSVAARHDRISWLACCGFHRSGQTGTSKIWSGMDMRCRPRPEIRIHAPGHALLAG